MKRFRVLENTISDGLAAHHIDCNSIKQISPFAVELDNPDSLFDIKTSTIVFMGHIERIEEVT